MANFLPLKNYMFYILDKVISQYPFTSPFLDIGCGKGDLVKHMTLKGFTGRGIDYSEKAVEIAKKRLAVFPNVKIEKKSLFDLEDEKFSTIFLWDGLEHLENDALVLEKIFSLLFSGGYVLLIVPSHPKEWRWDDDFYGHYRRYTPEDIRMKLTNAKLNPLIIYDCTYPIFWFMRRVYTSLTSPYPMDTYKEKEIRTKMSSTVNSWEMPILSSLLNNSYHWWKPFYFIQYHFFRNKLNKGHEIFVLAKKE